jgi:8-hydroxy-5-deazaflavin:NADPH oxidoreductase
MTRKTRESTRFGLLGTGPVGHTVGSKLVSLGHQVFMGSRDAANPSAAEWVLKQGDLARHGTFREAAAFGEIIINATSGSLDALETAGAENLNGKVLIDIANAMDFSTGILAYGNGDSLAERIQHAFPDAKVVKALNTVPVSMMYGQASAPGAHDVFVAGNDVAAKARVVRLLESFGWKRRHIIDLGDVTAARGAEGYMLLFYRLYKSLGTVDFNIGVVKQ